MKRYSIFMLLMLCSLTLACRKQGLRNPPDVFHDEYLQAYMENFLRDAELHNRAISSDVVGKLRVLKFVDDLAAQKSSYGQKANEGEDLAGVCANIEIDDSVGISNVKWKRSSKAWQEIWIKSSLVKRDNPTSPIVMRELLYHELGHCLLGLKHAPTAPHSIMSPEVYDNPDWLEKNWDRLSQELFKQN